MRAFHAPGGPGEILARVSFLEPLVAGRRVLELSGAAATAGASARALAERGAARVLAADEDGEGLARAAARSPHPAIEWRGLAPGELPEGEFDLVLVHDGAPLAALPERVAALAARLAPGGHLVAALPVAGAPTLAAIEGARGPAEAPAYESFVGSLEAVFPAVEIATQSAAVGWAIAAAADPEPELSVDGAFGEAPEAAAYLAVCGAAPAGLRGMVLVTLPAGDALRGAAARAAVDVEEIRAEAGGAQAEEAERREAAAREEIGRGAAAAQEAAERARAAEEAAEALRAKAEELAGALAAARAAEAERTRERDEARRESYARAREARAWADAQGKLEQRILELETLIVTQARELEIAHGEAARAIADASDARARDEESRYEADAAERRAEGAEAELRRLAKDLADGRDELDRLRAALDAARDRAAEGGER